MGRYASFQLRNTPNRLIFMHKNTEDKPPFLSSWKNWYWLVGSLLALMIGLLYWFSVHFSA
jgi:hypothetical protein